MINTYAVHSVSIKDKILVRFWVRFLPGTGPLLLVVPHQNPVRCTWAGLPPTTHYFNLTTWALIKYLSCDHIMTSLICRLSSFIRFFTSHIQICDLTIIRWVTIKNPRNLPTLWCYLTAIQRRLVQSQIWMREVKKVGETWKSTYQSCRDMMTTQTVIGSQRWRNQKMELQSRFHPAKKPLVCVQAG